MTPTQQPDSLWPVAVFAYNESHNIKHCLDSLLANRVAGHTLQVHVLVNGCTDDTLEVVREYGRSHPEVIAHHIQVGDKANAWNVYLHELAPASAVHFFIDGDVQASPKALAVLAATLAARPECNAAAALPTTGRHLEAARADMLATSQLAGNLYALSGDFARRVKEYGIVMPVGFIGEDSLVGAFAKWNLDAGPGSWSDTRIVACPDAGFQFDSLSAGKSSDWKLYWRRRIRYSIRKIQLILFRECVKRDGLRNTPKDVLGLYAHLDKMAAPEWHGLDLLFGRLAMRRIRAQMAERK